MSKKHDENQDVNILKRNFYVNQGFKTIQASHSQVIGIRTWARIDYLCHYCGYHLIWGDTMTIDKTTYENSNKKKEFRDAKKAARQNFNSKNKRTRNYE